MNPQETYKRLKRIINLKSNYTINHFSLFFKMMLDSWLGVTNGVINTFYGGGTVRTQTRKPYTEVRKDNFK